MTPALRALTDFVLATNFTADVIRERALAIHRVTLSRSRFLRQGNFTAIHPEDLALLFHLYDTYHFEGLLQPALSADSLTFHLSTRMTRAGGRTTRLWRENGKLEYEISIACSLLFGSFRQADRPITVCGIVCADRLQAMQRIFEHELVHLVEMLVWESSNCSADRFQNLARRRFLHESHTHQLITYRERAIRSGVPPGTKVSFEFEGQRLDGRVNRITKRATVLVEDPSGRLFSDGLRYRTYYVPINRLQRLQPEA